MASPDKDDKGGKDDKDVVYISADCRVCSSAGAAIDASLSHESTSGTGAGCSQSSDNVKSSK
jgi:hypothetical protein